ncbi:hypothetical protein V8G54_005428, partial [Vigna mungo]
MLTVGWQLQKGKQATMQCYFPTLFATVKVVLASLVMSSATFQNLTFSPSPINSCFHLLLPNFNFFIALHCIANIHSQTSSNVHHYISETLGSCFTGCCNWEALSILCLSP